MDFFSWYQMFADFFMKNRTIWGGYGSLWVLMMIF